MNMLQAKLSVGSSSDPLEHEADRAADRALRQSDPGITGTTTPDLQRRGHAGQAGATTAPASVERALSDSGKPLDATLQADMSVRFGHDFSGVRVHSGQAAAQSARDLDARAYTVGRDVVFGAGQLAPGTDAGRRLIAHELAHVVQQDRGARRSLQRAPASCATTKRADADADVVAKANAAAADATRLPELYLALKRARACFSTFDEAAFLVLVPATTKIYSAADRKSVAAANAAAAAKDDPTLVWAESLKPFAGYLLSGFDTANRLLTGGNKKKIGGTLAPSHKHYSEFADKQNQSTNRPKAQKAFSEANILVFSGHQYAQYKLPGVWNTGNWDTTLDVRGITGPLPNVKLLIGTSCATLCKEAFDVWKTLFPNAVFLGAAKSTPLEGSKLANAFVANLPNDLLFDPGAPGLSGAINAWKTAIEKTQSGDVRGGVLDIAAATIEYWDGKAWQSLKATDAANACKVKDDYSASVPDPRATTP